MKRSTRVFTLTVLVMAMVMFFALAGFVTASPSPVQAAGTRTFTFANNTSQTI